MSTNRRVFRWILALTCLSGAVLALAEIETPLRLILTPMFLLIVPGAAVMGLLRDRDPLAALSVGAAASLVINVLLATAMLSFDAWSPRAGVATIAVLGGFIYVLRVLYRGGGSLQTEQGARSR
ncbi:hypothetical protein [Planomonospora venezuelensis]|uniref:Putative membrane protein n=1 Tax=Planomonospora venezuelensis TaxID=1999 RepID=A0A841D4E0_PLAVE|nr:hypothetical protein [Planomonospora venezuelensis]MBB5962336.1 putative membrane protein [Planomonospora venezuelensis]GIN00716.1 hypothetical protein Pve01_23740 [Planomonospora venezuelensis]